MTDRGITGYGQVVRQAHHERVLCYGRIRLLADFAPTHQGNRILTRATQATVVPAKAGIQEIPRKRAFRLPRILDSGLRRNDGFMLRLIGARIGFVAGRGGFVTRPASKAKKCRKTGVSWLTGSCPPSQGGLQTRPYNPPEPVRVSTTNKCWEYPFRGIPILTPRSFLLDE